MPVPAPPLSIVAVGARTPLGLSAEASAAAARGGIARIQGYPYLVDDSDELLTAGVDARLDHRLHGVTRLAPLLASALQEAMAKGPGDIIRALKKIPLLLALPEQRPGFTDNDVQKLVSEISAPAIPSGARRAGPEIQVEVAGRGHAGALLALETAKKRLEKSPDELCLIAGVDSYLEPKTLGWLDQNRQLVRAGVRNGFHPGEAAGALLLAGSAVRMAQPKLAMLRGVATSREARLIKGETECLGEGLTCAIAAVTGGLRLPAEAVDAVYCDINGEKYRTEEWGFALLRNQKAVRETRYEAPADLWGDIGAASPVLGIILAVQAWARRYARGPRALVWASSEGGLRGAAVLERPVESSRG